MEAPVIRELTCGCYPTGLPSILLSKADLCLHIFLYSYPDSNIKARKSKIQFTLHWTGSTFCSTHQLTHLFQVDEYVERVPSLLDETIRSEALSDIPSSAKLFLRQTSLLIGLFNFGQEDDIGFEDPLVSSTLMAKWFDFSLKDVGGLGTNFGFAKL